MPLYEYQCQTCGNVSEAMQRMSDPPLSECQECGGELKKLVSAPAFQFKGSGWYVTDYADKGGSKDGNESAESKDSSDKGAATSDDSATSSKEKSTDSSKSSDSVKTATGKTKTERVASNS